MLGGCRARAAEAGAREAEQAALKAAEEAADRAEKADKDRVAAVKAAKVEAAAAVSWPSDNLWAGLTASELDAALRACASRVVHTRHGGTMNHEESEANCAKGSGSNTTSQVS